MSRLRFFALAAVAASTLGVAAACSLGLDETLLDRADATPEVETGPADTSVDVLPPTPDGGTCARDEDCVTTHGCLRGRCDLSRGACAYDVCKQPACNSAACNTGTQQCGAPKPYRYRAGTFAIGAPVSCFRCVAAVHPWLVVLTASGPLAFNVSDPQAMAATPVPITGVGFYPNFLVQSGSRVFFFGPNQGPNPTRLPIAWIDLPADPFTTALVAKSVLATLNRPPEAATPASREGDSILYIGPVAASYASSILQPPLSEPLSIMSTPLTFTAATTPVGVSGSRLVMRQINNGTPIYGLIPDAGSGAPGAQQDVTLTDAGFVGGGEAFAQLPSGALFWVVNSITAPPVPGPATTRALRGYFLLANGTSGFDPAAGVDIEVYSIGPPPGVGSAFAAPNALVDPKLAIVTAAARENTAQTSVQFVRREPLELVRDVDAGAKRTVLPIANTTIVGAAASNGIGYVVANDVPMNATVYVFDPTCPP